MKSEKKKKNLLILGAALLLFHFSLRGFSFRGGRSVVRRVAMIDGIMRSAIFICFGTYIPFLCFRKGKVRVVGCLLGGDSHLYVQYGGFGFLAI